MHQILIDAYMDEIADTVDRFSGMITREQAERMAASREKAGTPAAEATDALRLSEFISAQRSSKAVRDSPAAYIVNITDKVYRVFNKVEYRRNGRNGASRIVVMGRENHTIKLNLLDRFAELADSLPISRSDVILVKNASLEMGRGELRSTNATQISVISHSEAAKAEFGDMAEGDRNVDVIGKVIEIGPIRYVSRLGGDGQIAVSECTITDAKTPLQVSLWGSSALMTTKLAINDTVKIEFCSVRSRNGRMELYASDLSRVLIKKPVQ